MYSFDVLDTLITRRTGSPYGIFALMKDRLRAEKSVNGLEDFMMQSIVWSFG